MTAIIGVMNKQAVAIAADSAVTIQGAMGRRILNHANKIFTLSKYHPVGIMIYNSASFMGVPWETIIKIYRRELGDTKFNLLENYSTHFLQFLHDKKFFTDEASQEEYLGSIIEQLFEDIKASTLQLNGGITDSTVTTFVAFLKKNIESITNQIIKLEKCPDFSSYTLDEFKVKAKNIFNKIEAGLIVVNSALLSIYPEVRSDFEKLAFEILTRKESFTNNTGLVFVGFGEEDLFPQLRPFNIFLAFDSRLKFYLDKDRENSISNTCNAAICPFAQTDVIETIITGIDPILENIYNKNIFNIFTILKDAILKLIPASDQSTINSINSFDLNPIFVKLLQLNGDIKLNKYIRPLLNTISYLSKEDLVEVVESLISLTSLKRRMTSAEESVGGPVDVALISKGDGFIWMKRKHYFDADLNYSFFEKYFNN